MKTKPERRKKPTRVDISRGAFIRFMLDAIREEIVDPLILAQHVYPPEVITDNKEKLEKRFATFRRDLRDLAQMEQILDRVVDRVVEEVDGCTESLCLYADKPGSPVDLDRGLGNRLDDELYSRFYSVRP